MQKADIIAALTNVGADLRCPSCGHHQWRAVIGSWDEADVTLRAIADDGISQTAIDLHCGVLVCCRCGFLRLHSTEQLRQGGQVVESPTTHSSRNINRTFG